jgi:hypothetical protein
MKTTPRNCSSSGRGLDWHDPTAIANAECGYYPPSHKAAPLSAAILEWVRVQYLLALVSGTDPTTRLSEGEIYTTAQGNTGPGAPPDGVPLDIGFTQWHSDGTEIINSGRPPQDGSICLGVWEKTGKSRYKFNHFATGYDTANAPTGIGNPTGPTHIVGDVMVSRDGKHYAGTFTLDAYDTSNTLIAHLVGVITATRITVHTPASSIF